MARLLAALHLIVCAPCAFSQPTVTSADFTGRALLGGERERAVAAREIALRDSRLGYEWEQDYIYSPDTIDEKIKVIDDTLARQIPAYRRQQGF